MNDIKIKIIDGLNKNSDVYFQLEKDKENIGKIFLKNLDWINRSTEVIFNISNQYLEDSLKLLMKQSFEFLNLNRIYIKVPEYEKDKIEILKGCGFLKEGLERQGIFFKGKFWDLLCFSILAEEYWRLSENFEK
ncbi:GNAT family N-acetyltransferase [Thermosipho melanesiensis]|uniref:N-acetyltransferase domain-containing protein n=2 Tax=Thermosipho melanesiensis TaxID=46541 RepID=A6LKF4_THEM4|nr:GNAT family protein [Thermosipho melanesiensis]ABR30405.1 hypothetical protein Tmel_0538 [Thermosipho melanesiensis BI429]APT74831.1 hypothetical protein BW47_02870 [Thermosipho melanesiensis]